MKRLCAKIEISYTCPCLRPMFPFGHFELTQIVKNMCAQIQAYCPNFNPKINLVLCDDNLSEELNNRWLATPGPTNTLAFAGEPPKIQHQLFFSLNTWRRECVLYDQNPKDYARRLLAHGLAHLAGFDHSPAMDEICDSLQLDAE